MDRKALQDKINKISGDIDAIFAKATAESRAVTAEEMASIERLEGDHEAAKADLSRFDAAEAARLRNEERKRASTTPAPRRASPDQPGGAPVITSQHENFEDDPNKGFRDHREFLGTVILAGQRGGYTEDKRLKFLTAAPNPNRMATAGSDEQSTVSDAYGGYLLPVGFMPQIMSRGVEADPTAALTTKIPMTAAQLPINCRVDSNHSSSVSGGFQVYRREETQAVSASRQSYEQVVLNAHSLFGVAYTSEELLSRSPVSFMALIEAGFRDEFPAKLLREKLNGATGGYGGVIGAACAVDVAKETGQAGATVVYENLAKMMSRCWRYSSSVWLYNHDVLPQLMGLVINVGTGGVPVWQPSARDGAPNTILGRPAYATEFCKTLGTSGDIILGVWSEYLEGTLTGMQSAESMHVRFENHERVVKFWMENDGRPWWGAALTPAVSANTLSPFVTLATRA